MSTRLRRKRANSVVWGLLALVMVGFGGYGVTSFSTSQREIGHVGNRPITINEYASLMRREEAAFSAQTGQPVGFQKLFEFGVDKAVLGQLVAAATLENQAMSLGLSVGDAQVRERILSAPALQGPDGAFNRDVYSQFLRSQGLSEAEFEATLRAEAARTLLEGALVGNVPPSDALVDKLTAWEMETRAYTLAELLPSDLPDPVADATEDQLNAWYDSHGDAYMRPETRRISYVWLKPDDLVDQVEVDEDALKAAYEERKSEFIVPERRLVARLVYPTAEEASAAKARLDKGEVSFEALVSERGLTVEDVDLGEAAREELGAAGDAVFALTEPGVAGPVDTDLGPALFAMNGILSAQETTFDEARDDLKSEIAMDRARRQIGERQEEIEDLLASGATLEEVARDIGMEFGQIEFNSETEGGLAAYEPFRQAAAEVTADSFPSLAALDDGGVFAIRLDEIIAASPLPFDEARDRVAEDWRQDAVHAALVALAGEQIAQVQNGATLESLGLVTSSNEAFARGAFVADAVPAVGKAVFDMTAGDAQVIDDSGRVFLLVLRAVNPAAPDDADVQARRTQIRDTVAQSVGRDIFDLYTRAAQSTDGLVLNQQAIDAINTQLQ